MTTEIIVAMISGLCTSVPAIITVISSNKKIKI